MEKLLGKVVHTSGFGEFARDFLEWAGPGTAWIKLDLNSTHMQYEVVKHRNEESPRVIARGLQGGGGAVAAWAESEGWIVLADEPDHVSIETKLKDFPKTAREFAAFLAPNGSWTITEATARHKA